MTFGWSAAARFETFEFKNATATHAANKMARNDRVFPRGKISEAASPSDIKVIQWRRDMCGSYNVIGNADRASILGRFDRQRNTEPQA